MAGNLIILFGVSLAWACDYLFIASADRAFPPVTIAAGVTGVAAIVLLAVVGGVMRRPLLPTLRARPWLPVVMAATAVAAPRLSVIVAENTITPDISALTGTTVPILTFLATVFVTRTAPFSLVRLVGVLVALMGLLIFVGLGDLSEHKAELTGILIMMSGGVAFVINGLLSDAKAGDLDPLVLTVWVMLFAALGLVVLAPVVEGFPAALPTGEAIGSVLASGVVGVALAYLGYFLLLARAGAGFTALYAFLVPPLGVFAGIVVLGEPMTVEHGAGLVVMLFGLWMIVGRTPRAAATTK